MVRVCLVSGHPLFSAGLARLLQEDPRFELAAVLRRADQIPAWLDAPWDEGAGEEEGVRPFDLILLDHAEASSPEACRWRERVLSWSRHVPVICLSLWQSEVGRCPQEGSCREGVPICEEARFLDWLAGEAAV